MGKTKLIALCIAMLVAFNSFGTFRILVDPRDLRSKEHEAAYTMREGDDVVWTTAALSMPDAQKHSDSCARIPEYMDGAICYRICGGGLTSQPIGWTYQWRRAHQGHDTRWEECNGDGCSGFNSEYYADAQRGCGHFKIWKAVGHERDLRIRIKLAS